MGSIEDSRLPVVRIFPDYADTVLWLDGPFDYDECGLSDRLIQDLRRWEQSYYDGLNAALEWRTPALARQFTNDGERLAQHVAGELGEGFVVEFRSYEEAAPVRRFHSSGPGSPAAAAAFNRRAAAMRGDRERLARLKAGDEAAGGTSGWFACAPAAGAEFRPAPRQHSNPDDD